jgi:N-methylhydantoinase B/oxoprolinase/acetone carboxylase alpha subunit
VAWAPAVTWVSSLYEVFGRLFQMRGFIEEMAAGSGTIMTAEFSGINQTGMYLTGLTLEQASQGSPARGFADGENSAWCIYTPEADFGNAEISELYYPILFLGRNIAPDSGGFGQFRGGLGHTAVWMVYNTPGLEYQCGDAGMRSKIVGNHGMYGAYPTVPDRPAYAHDTNVKELIEAQKPLIHERGDPDKPALASVIKARVVEDNAIAPFVTPEPLVDYDIIVHPIAGAQAMGDPLKRDLATIANDLNESWTTERVAKEIHGAVFDKRNGSYVMDGAKTAKQREKIRKNRIKRAVPFKQWWEKERKKVEGQQNMDPAAVQMWRSSMELSPKYAAELRAFWQLPEDFTFGD